MRDRPLASIIASLTGLMAACAFAPAAHAEDSVPAPKADYAALGEAPDVTVSTTAPAPGFVGAWEGEWGVSPGSGDYRQNGKLRFRVHADGRITDMVFEKIPVSVFEWLRIRMNDTYLGPDGRFDTSYRQDRSGGAPGWVNGKLGATSLRAVSVEASGTWRFRISILARDRFDGVRTGHWVAWRVPEND